MEEKVGGRWKRWKKSWSLDCSHPSLPVFISNFEGDPPHLQNINVRAGSESQVILLSPRYIIMLPFWHHLEWIFSLHQPPPMGNHHHLAFFLRRNKHGHSSGRAWVAFVRICHWITWSSGPGSGLAISCQQEQWSSFTSMMETPPPEATLKAPSDHKYKKITYMAMWLWIVSSWIILYKTNSLLFEREARSPDDRPITKNPDHALGASCCECFQESQRTESTKEIDNDLKQGIFKDDFHQNAQFTSFTCKLYNGCKCKGSLVVATDHCWGTMTFKDL